MGEEGRGRGEGGEREGRGRGEGGEREGREREGGRGGEREGRGEGEGEGEGEREGGGEEGLAKLSLYLLRTLLSSLSPRCDPFDPPPLSARCRRTSGRVQT